MTDKPLMALDAAKLFVLAHPNHGNAVQVIQMIDEARAALSATQGDLKCDCYEYDWEQCEACGGRIYEHLKAPTAAPDAWQPDEIPSEYIKLIRETPFLTSLLYDFDLLPEQLMAQKNFTPGLRDAYERLRGVIACYEAMQHWNTAAPKANQ